MENLRKGVRPYEIIHTKNQDIIINNTHSNSLLLANAVQQVQNGISRDWLLYRRQKRHFSVFTRDQSLYDYHNAVFFLKPKRYFGSDYEHLDLSVINELSLSPHIVKILQSAQARTIADEHEYKRIEFVEPLVAIIDRTLDTRNKYILYPFIHGDTCGSPRTSERDAFEGRDLDKLVEDLQDLFISNNIQPNDLGIHQLIASTEEDPIPNSLFLLDIEDYASIGKHTSIST